MISFRKASINDLEFIIHLIEISFKEYILLSGQIWKLQEQESIWKKKLLQEKHKIILYKDMPIGMYSINETHYNISIDGIFLLPKYQNKKIGSNIILDTIHSAQKTNKTISLKVLKSNSKAKNFYTKLGFYISGETDSRWHMNYSKNS